MSKYQLYEKQRQQAQESLNDFISQNGAVITKYAELINEHMAATNKANKALLEEQIESKP